MLLLQNCTMWLVRSLCATKKSSCCPPSDSSNCLQAAAVDSCPGACLLLCATCCMILDGGRKVAVVSDASIVYVLLLHESTALVLTIPNVDQISNICSCECVALCCCTLTEYENAFLLTVVHVCRFTAPSWLWQRQVVEQ